MGFKPEFGDLTIPVDDITVLGAYKYLLTWVATVFIFNKHHIKYKISWYHQSELKKCTDYNKYRKVYRLLYGL